MAQHQVLFCPFCRESFEGQSQCPEHELPLVPLTRLVPEAGQDEDPEDDQEQAKPERDLRPVGLFDPSLARGWVALGAICQLAAFPLPLLRVPPEESVATYELARAIPSLWTLSLIAFTVFYTLARRRTPRSLRSLRVVMPALAAVALACLLWAFGRLGFHASPETGTYLIAWGALLLAIGGSRLGALRPSHSPD